jgi:KR domain
LWLVLQTGEGWNDAVLPKAVGAVNLDMFSRGISSLKHFVMFSSCVTMLGNQGGLLPALRDFSMS